MKSLAIVPARAGSKRLPGKNLLDLGGKPLVARAIEAALAAKRIDLTVVSSDDPAVLEVARRYPGAVAIERPAALAHDESPAIDYVQHVLAVLAARGQVPEIITIIQPSSPLTLPADVDATVALLEETGADSAVSVMRLDHAVHPVKLKRLDWAMHRLDPYWEDESGRFAAEQLPELYVRNCAVYVTRRTVVERNQILGDDCRGYVMPRERSVDINELVDYQFARFLWQQHAAV